MGFSGASRAGLPGPVQHMCQSRRWRRRCQNPGTARSRKGIHRGAGSARRRSRPIRELCSGLRLTVDGPWTFARSATALEPASCVQSPQGIDPVRVLRARSESMNLWLESRASVPSLRATRAVNEDHCSILDQARGFRHAWPLTGTRAVGRQAPVSRALSVLIPSARGWAPPVTVAGRRHSDGSRREC